MDTRIGIKLGKAFQVLFRVYQMPYERNLLRKVNNYFYLFYFLSQNIFAYYK